jgi:hypothetical protein
VVDFIDIAAASLEDLESPVHEADDALSSLPFTPREVVGHGIVAIADAHNLEHGKNRAYAAVESCVQAVQFFERQQLKQLRSASGLKSPGGIDIAVYLPLVVLQGRLFALNVTSSGQEVIREVPSAAVHFRAGSAPGILVPIVTTSILGQFAELARTSWIQIGQTVAQPGAAPGETESMLRLLIEMRGWSNEDRPSEGA